MNTLSKRASIDLFKILQSFNSFWEMPVLLKSTLSLIILPLEEYKQMVLVPSRTLILSYKSPSCWLLSMLSSIIFTILFTFCEFPFDIFILNMFSHTKDFA